MIILEKKGCVFKIIMTTRVWRYHFVVLLLAAVALTHEPSSRYDDDRARTVDNILRTNGWRWMYDDTSNVAGQRIFVNGSLNTFADVVGHPARVNANNARSTSAAMYAAFGCKCVETIVEIANATAGRPVVIAAATRDILIRFNGTISKAVSALVDLADLAPDVLSHEPGALNVALLFNFHVNRLIETLSEIEPSSAYDRENVAFVLYQLTNEAERHVISDCSPNAVRTVPMTTDDRDDDVKHAAPSIESFDRLLDTVGLWTAKSWRYNIGGDGSPVDVSTRVSDGLQSVMDVRSVIPNRPATDLESYYLRQKSIFDLIMTIVYQNTARGLKAYGRKPVADDNNYYRDNYFDCGNGCDELIRTYENLLIESRVKKFPSDFTNHVGLILRLLEDVRAYGTVGDWDVVTRKIDEELLAIASSGPNDKYLFDGADADGRMLFTEIGLELHTFLARVLSVDRFEQFNRIFIVLGAAHGNGERDSNAIWDMNAAGIERSQHLCLAMTTLYAHCFHAETAVNDCTSDKCLGDVKKNFTQVLSVLDAIIAFERSRNACMTSILERARVHLSYNLVDYPTGGDVRQKVLRIAFHVTNSADRYQMYNYDYAVLRSDRRRLYDAFARNPGEKESHMDLNVVFAQRDPFGRNGFAFDGKKTASDLDGLTRKPLVAALDAYKSVRVYWRGQLKTIVHVSERATDNVFDPSSLPKYVRLVSKWAASVLLYATVDLLNCVLLTADHRTNDKRLKSVAEMYEEKLRHVNVPADILAVTRTTAAVLSSASHDYKSSNIFGLRIVLEQHLEKYDFVVEAGEPAKCKIEVHVTKLNNIFDKLTRLWLK